ncbi:MAG: TonB-dependent receptor [Robiginitomaculum sp.]
MLKRNIGKGKLRKAILLSSAVLFVGAQMASADQFNVPSQSLNAALSTLAAQAGAPISYDPRIVKGLSSVAVNGDMSVGEALRLMLSSGTLEVVQTDSGEFFVVRKGDNPENYDEFLTAKPLDEVVVTATGLRTGTTSQVMTIDTLEIKRLGLGSVDDLMRILPQNFSNINSATNNGILINSGDGSGSTRHNEYGRRPGASAGTGANLRGLGNNATLTLINGRRITQDSGSTASFSDISIIPIAAIERVEVLTDGASTVYGSGAIAGVINFILKKDYKGAETSVRYENSQTGGDSITISQVAGFGNERARIMGGVTYSKTDPVLTDKLVDSLDLRSAGGYNFEDFSTISGGVFYKYSKGVRVDNHSDIFGVVPKGNTAPSKADLVTAGVKGRKRMPLYLTPEQKRTSGFLNFGFDLTDSIELFAEGIYSHRNVSSQGDYIFAKGTFMQAGFFKALVDTRAPNGKAPIVHMPGADLADITDLFSGNGVSYGYVFDRETDAGLMPRVGSRNKQENYNFNLGANYKLPMKEWKGVSAVYHSSDASVTNLIASRVSGSHSRFDNSVLMLMKGYSLDGKTAVDPLNLFGDGTQNSQATLDRLYFDLTNTSSSSVLGFQTIVDGPIFKIAGGDVKLAFGVDYYIEKLEADHLEFHGKVVRKDAMQSLPGSKQTAFAVFGELNFPLIGEGNRRRGLYAFDIGVAARYDKFEGEGFVRNSFYLNSTKNVELYPDFFPGVFGMQLTEIANARDLNAVKSSSSAFSPKVGIKWRPVESTQVYLNWSESFRMPTLHDRFYIPAIEIAQLITLVQDPKLDADGNALDENVERGSGTVLTGGNAKLKPVTANNYSLGIDFAPQFFDGLNLSFKYAYIDLRNEITTLSNDELLDKITDLANADLYKNIVSRDSFGFINSLDLRPINIAKTISKTMDFAVDYRFDQGEYDFNVGANLTRTLSHMRQVAEGAPEEELSGTESGPLKWQGFGYIGVRKGNWHGRVNLRHQGAYENTRRVRGLPTPTLTDVKAYNTVDVNVSYNFDDESGFMNGTRITVGVNNLLSPDFPLFNESPTFDTSRVDARRRVMYVDIKKEF